MAAQNNQQDVINKFKFAIRSSQLDGFGTSAQASISINDAMDVISRQPFNPVVQGPVPDIDLLALQIGRRPTNTSTSIAVLLKAIVTGEEISKDKLLEYGWYIGLTLLGYGTISNTGIITLEAADVTGEVYPIAVNTIPPRIAELLTILYTACSTSSITQFGSESLSELLYFANNRFYGAVSRVQYAVRRVELNNKSYYPNRNDFNTWVEQRNIYEYITNQMLPFNKRDRYSFLYRVYGLLNGARLADLDTTNPTDWPNFTSRSVMPNTVGYVKGPDDRIYGQMQPATGESRTVASVFWYLVSVGI